MSNALDLYAKRPGVVEAVSDWVADLLITRSDDGYFAKASATGRMPDGFSH